MPGGGGTFAAACGFYGSERVFPVDIDMVSHERAEACDVFVSHGISLGAQLVQGSINIDRIPQNDTVQNDTQCAKLILSEMILKALGGLRSAGAHAL